MPNNHIGHNKFLVYVDKNGKPRAVLFGSTNWTPTGLCTQTNNTLVIDNAEARAALPRLLEAARGRHQGRERRGQEPAGHNAAHVGRDRQDDRARCGRDRSRAGFRRTRRRRARATKNEKRPPDMAALVKRIDGAEHAILFLAFYPGTPSIANWAADALRARTRISSCAAA